MGGLCKLRKSLVKIQTLILMAADMHYHVFISNKIKKWWRETFLNFKKWWNYFPDFFETFKITNEEIFFFYKNYNFFHFFQKLSGGVWNFFSSIFLKMSQNLITHISTNFFNFGVKSHQSCYLFWLVSKNHRLFFRN